MALDFPSNPTNGQVFNQYVYNSTIGAWKNYNDNTAVTSALLGKANLSGGNTFTGNQTFSSGLVSNTSAPAFRALRTADFAGFNASSQTNPFVFNATDYNIGNHYNASNGRFTAPIAGRYVFFAGIYSSVNPEQIWPIINGVRQQSFVVLGGTINITGCGVFYLNANDTFAITPWASGNTNFTVYANIYHTYLHGAYIG